ncbi:MAG TPA: hypothetical protein VHO07_22660 [Streptosporangiaceae bacterium]|nr:hypothetical protein [Streptosporangiaceae bacterium]HEX2822937.1 hypothetical protein [Streptosporangiaceae bacterium]
MGDDLRGYVLEHFADQDAVLVGARAASRVHWPDRARHAARTRTSQQ